MRYLLFFVTLLTNTIVFSIDFTIPKNYFIKNESSVTMEDENSVIFLAKVYGMTACFTSNGVYFSKKDDFNYTFLNEALHVQNREEQRIAIVFKNASTKLINGESKLGFPLLFSGENLPDTKTLELYQTIRYTDIYPNIDVVFSLPDQGGLKYEFILHDGAKIDDIRVIYEGANKIEQNANNDLVVSGSNVELVEKNLMAYYAKTKKDVNVEYTFIDQTTVGFKTDAIVDQYPLIIDPWVVFPSLSNMPVALSCPLAIENDDNGYLYVFFKKIFLNAPNWAPASSLVKYNQAGTIQWVFDFSGIPYFAGQGDIAVNKTTGDIYITGGDIASGGFTPLLLRLNTNGILQPTPNSMYDFEANTCFFNQCDNKVYTGVSGNLTQPTSHIMIYNPVTANATFVNCGFPLGENVMMTPDPDGTAIYLATFNPAPFGNQGEPETFRVSKVLYSNLGIEAWTQNASGLELVEELSPLYAGTTGDAFKGLTASLNFLYGFDGSKIVQFDKNTGAVINTVTTAFAVGTTSGIVADECGNIYVGVGNTIRMYDANLTLLNQITTPTICHDLTIIADRLYACGGGGELENSNPFVEEYTIATINQAFTLDITHSICGNCSGTATVSVSGCNDAEDFVYHWSSIASIESAVTELCEGEYTVYVTLGCDTLYEETFEILENQSSLSIDLGSDTTICSENVVLDANVAGVTYEWSTGETTQDITVTNSGDYWVAVTDQLGCTVSDSIQLQINEITVNIGEDTVLCDEITLLLNAGWQNSTYLWQDNSTNQVFQANLPGEYWVIVDSSGCIGRDTISIMLVQTPTLELSWTDICLGDTAEMVVQGAEIYSWSPTNEIILQNQNSILSSPNQTTEFQVIGSTQGCADTLTALLTVFSLPELTFSGLTTICKGDSTEITVSGGAIEYQWTPAAGITNVSGNSVTLFPNQTTNYLVHAVDANGCEASQPIIITLEEIMIIVNDLTLCGADDIGNLTANGADFYTWSPTNGLSSITTSTTEVIVDETTIFQVIGQSTFGCLDTAYATVLVVPDFEVTVNSDSICEGESTLLIANGATTYSWTPLEGLNNVTGTEVLASPGNTTIYTVTGYKNGCYESAQSTVVVIPLTNATITATPNPVTTLESTVLFSSNIGNSSQSWYLDNLFLSAQLSFAYDMPQIAGEYLVFLVTQNELGCVSIDSIIIVVNDDIVIYVPNSFTPDNDGFNQIFIPVVSGEVDKNFGYTFQIYNRWGEVVFKTTDISNGWDGTYKGMSCPDGVYTWTIQYKAKYNSSIFEESGHVTLLR